MIKVIAMYSLPEGTDPEKFWKYHTEVHASDIKRAYGTKVKKYVINRVTKVLMGEPKFFGLMETWFENEEALAEADKAARTLTTPEGKSVVDDFASRVTQRFRALVEEKEITL
ncbi:MAG: EthD family reductase [Chloroflexi bacterium]|nr:EthD family reductase [Chloroflexota bacterium]